MSFDFGENIEGISTQPTVIQRSQLAYPLDQQSIQTIKRVLEETSTFKTIQLEPGQDIQGTIDKLSEEGGGRVLLAGGTYVMTNSLTLRNGV